ncbi:MAG: hypothetical protein KBD62_37310 [Kofleriaceae bacterium]|nr:hypothetical protein [Kofleriaceae bacterium]
MTGLRALVARLTEVRARYAAREVNWDVVADAEAILADAITPDVLAAVEAVVALGKWRATEPQCEPDYEIRDRLDAIADRLAAREGDDK